MAEEKAKSAPNQSGNSRKDLQRISKLTVTFFMYVRSKVGSREKIGPLKDDQGARVDDYKAMDEILNKIFSSVFTRNDIRNQISCSCVDLSDDTDQELWITEELILKHIGKLKDNKAAGTDELGSSFIPETGRIASVATDDAF